MTSRRPVRAAQSGLPVGLTFYDSAYAAVARARGGTLVTFDTELLRAALGTRPADVQLGVPERPRLTEIRDARSARQAARLRARGLSAGARLSQLGRS